MEFRTTAIPGCMLIAPNRSADVRGVFVKIFHEALFRRMGLETSFRECCYSVSRQGVLRGMHFQVPPRDHAKLVCCAQGCVLDAVLDVRIGSPSYGRWLSFEMSAENGYVLYVPPGLAHGFYCQSETALMVYHTTTVHSPEHDRGILWNSFGMTWPTDTPTLSTRDAAFETLSAFHSPFAFSVAKRGSRP